MSDVLPRTLEPAELKAIEARFSDSIREGLASDGREIRALPAFVGPPNPGLSGTALVLDTGGTNMRAALVRLSGDGGFEITGPVGRSLREQSGRSLTSEDFFRLHADLAQELDVPRDLPVGYCFSYPFEARPDGDARLIRWTKGISVAGVEGTLVGASLLRALREAGLASRSVRVLNDTVAALLGGAVTTRSSSSRHVGLIVGTGTNMASFFEVKEAPKLAVLAHRAMAVNLESGNFSPTGLSLLDAEIASSAEPVNQQRFEKAVSGLYLPLLYARARPEDAAWIEKVGARGLVERAVSGSHPGSSFARLLLLRSAQLAGTGLGAVASVRGGTDPMHVLAEGSLFWSWPGYEAEVRRVLGALEPEITFEIRRMEHANLVGAACAALSPNSGTVERPPN